MAAISLRLTVAMVALLVAGCASGPTGPGRGAKTHGFAFEATNVGSANAPGTATINGSQALSFTVTPGATERHSMTPPGNLLSFKADFPRSPEHGATAAHVANVDLGRCDGVTVVRFFVNATATSITVDGEPDRCER